MYSKVLCKADYGCAGEGLERFVIVFRQLDYIKTRMRRDLLVNVNNTIANRMLSKLF